MKPMERLTEDSAGAVELLLNRSDILPVRSPMKRERLRGAELRHRLSEFS